jgi:hypothetical protein
METPNKPNPDHQSTEAEAHFRSAHQILKALQEKNRRAPGDRSGNDEAGKWR